MQSGQITTAFRYVSQLVLSATNYIGLVYCVHVHIQQIRYILYTSSNMYLQ
jgi:hypothetical protein